MAIPTDLKEVCNVFRFNKLERWRELYLPGIFPYLVTGFVTASGGAWNASIIAEYFRFKGHTYTVTGLGSVISDATDTGNYRVLMGADDSDGCDGGNYQSPVVAKAVCASCNEI